MPGPASKKQSQRTKGNVKPSSSSQAAQLLSQSGAAPTGFIGFGTLTGTPGYVPVSQSLDDVDSSLDADFRMVLRKLTKRDSTTKLKALQEIATLCNEKDIEVVKAVLPFWPRIYNKIAMDIDHRVREATQQSMNTLVLRVRKNLAPYLKSLMGSWLLSQCDTYPTVASAAQQAFQTAFPPDKQVDALVFCKQEVTENLIDNLLKQTSLTLSDPKTTEPEDMESKYNRVMTSSLLALRKLITTLPDGELLPLSSQFDGLLKDSKLWKHGKSTIKSVRAAVFSFLAGFCQTYPQLAMEHSKKVSPFILHSVDESDPLICPCVWEAVLSLVNYVKDCWQHINVDKALWPKLRSLLENGCHGNATIIAGDLLPFLSKVPADIRGEDNRFYEEFFVHMKLSFSKEQVKASHIEQAALTKAYIECAYFVLRQLDAAQSSGAKCAHIILIDQVLPVVQVSLLERKSTLNKSQLYSQLGSMLSNLEATGSDITVDLVKTFWDDLGDSIEERIISPFEDLKGRKEFIHRVISFVKSLVVPETSLKSKKEAKVSFSADRNTEDKIVTIPSDRAELSALAKHFVQKLTLKSFEVCHKTWTPEVLHLFVALIELEPSEDTISKIIKYCHGDVESSQSHSHYFVFEVCLPWLHQSQAEGQEFQDPSQLLSVICTFIPLLDKDSVLSLLEKLCETITQWTSFHFLLEKVISLQLDVDGTREWLHSDALGNKLMTIATEVCKESMDETNFDRTEVQYGWDTLTLVLSKGYEIVKQEFIEKMLERIHQALVDIGQSSEVNKVNLAIRFVSKAVQSFFLSSKDCAMLPAAQELLLSLFKVSTDPSYDISDNSMHLAEEAWTSGIGRIVKQTGGFLQKDTLLYKTAEVIQSRILRVETLQKFKALVLVVQKVLSVLRGNVPSEEGENAVVKCYTQQLHLKEEQTVAKKVLDYILVKDNISLIDVPVQKVHSSHSLVQVLFTSLFNVRLLTIKSSTDTDQQHIEVDLQQREIILNILYGVVVVQLWMEMDRSVSKFADISKASESLQTGIAEVLQCMPQTEKNQLLQYALQRSENKGNLWVLALQKLLSIFSAQSEFTLELSPLLDRCADLTKCNVQMLQVCLDVMEEASCTTLSEIMVARLISCPPDTVLQVEGGLGALAVLNTSLRRSQQQCVTDLCQATLSQIEEWKDQIDELMLCESNLKDASYQMVLFNVEIVKFLQFCVQAIPAKFSEKDWDFVLCSMVSLTQSIEESYGVLQTNMAVQSFTSSVCRLLATVAHCIKIKLSQEPSAFPANLQTEWNEFFSDGAYSILIPIFNNVINDLKGQNITGTSHILLQSIGLALSYCPKQQVLDHKLPAYLIADQLSVLPDHLQTLMNRLCPLLSHSDHSVQITVFKMLRSVITDLAQYDKEVKDNPQAKVKDDPDDKAEEQTSRSPPPQLMNIVENSSVAMEIVLSDLTVEECQCVKPNTEEFQFTMAYLLAWKLLLEFFRSAPAELRQEYATFFRDSASVSHLMSNVFRLMSDNPSSVDKVSSSSMTLFECPWQPSVDDEPSSLEIQHLACQVYTDALRTMPAMVRQWWKDQDRKTSNYIDKYTSKFVSQMLCTEELKSVSKTDVNLEYITIRARPTTKEVIATYALEEVSIEIVISLPQNYPLGNISVTSEKKVGVTAGVWDRWLLQLNIFLQYQNGNIVDGLRIWKKNIDKRFEGVDDCMICFSVLHGTNFQLPRLLCKTCKKKFHSACLYKWFQTSHNATCPLCRNLF